MRYSVITINFNNKNGLSHTINSVISQTNTDFEFIIIDGGSDDGSKDIIKMTMVNGKVLYQDNKFYVGEDIKDIYSKVQKLTEELSVIKR